MGRKRLSIGFSLAIFTVTLFVTSTWAASHESVLHVFKPNGTDGAFPEAGLITDAAGNRYGTTYYGGTYNSGAVFELTPTGGGGWTEKVLHNFNNNGTDGAFPFASLIFDAAGDLYGTTEYGGTHNVGMVFELTPAADGGWTEKVLHNFNNNGTDGVLPLDGGLIFDVAGNLYGTTWKGGTHNVGTVFQLTPQGGGGWTEKVLHSFGNGMDGAYPYAGLIFDAAGNLYSTTVEGGAHNVGTVVELTPSGGGGWTEKVLYSFNLNGTDGAYPDAGLIVDAAGNLYGTTSYGGHYNVGTVFELTYPKTAGGGWTEHVLHSFGNGTDGAYPEAGLIVDAAGNLYGTTSAGGTYNSGTVVELTPSGGGGWTEKVLHNFNLNGTDGVLPYAGLLFDAAGNLYGTASYGAANGGGAVFELTPQSGGGWTEQVLHNFNFNGTDGANPYLAVLIFDAAGNLYGTTDYGGAYDSGAVFQLTPQADGGWTEKLLYSLGNGADGANPFAALIFDAAGNIYGTALQGGTDYAGAVFQLTPQADGGWTEKVLHNFNNNGTDGAFPFAGLVIDAAGNLYGTTNNGGTYNSGTVFELTPQADGGWTEKLLHNFNNNGTDGTFPVAGLIIDAAGNLYGTTEYGGTYNVGTVFKLTPQADGGWTEKLLYSFNSNGTDGRYPFGSLIFDAAGNLYGTTSYGGTYNVGAVFELTPQSSGGWTEKLLHNFNLNGTDGAFPEAGLIFDAAGNLYGTTFYGGTYSVGTVFKLTYTPNAAGGRWTEKVLYNFKSNGTDGTSPFAGVIFDAAGNLYGTTNSGGTYNSGTVFEITP